MCPIIIYMLVALHPRAFVLLLRLLAFLLTYDCIDIRTKLVEQRDGTLECTADCLDPD